MPNQVFTFSFNGKNCLEFGLYATSYDVIIPPKRGKHISIPFRHGSYIYPQQYYDDRVLKLTVFWLANKLPLIKRSDIREMSYWYSQRGRIILDVEPDKSYYGELFNPQDLEIMYDRAIQNIETINGGFELNFRCDPFAVGIVAETKINTNILNAVSYEGTAETPTLITLTNTSNQTIIDVTIISNEFIKFPKGT